jgi:hypothetical protein
MVARRKFWYHAAVFLVHRDLRVQGVGKQAALRVVQSKAGFIAGGFDTEDNHGMLEKRSGTRDGRAIGYCKAGAARLHRRAAAA